MAAKKALFVFPCKQDQAFDGAAIAAEGATSDTSSCYKDLSSYSGLSCYVDRSSCGDLHSFADLGSYEDLDRAGSGVLEMEETEEA